MTVYLSGIIPAGRRVVGATQRSHARILNSSHATGKNSRVGIPNAVAATHLSVGRYGQPVMGGRSSELPSGTARRGGGWGSEHWDRGPPIYSDTDVRVGATIYSMKSC